MKNPKKTLKVSLFVILGLMVLGILVSSINNRIGNCEVNGKIAGLGTRLALVSGFEHSGSYRYFKIILVINGEFSVKVRSEKSGGGRIITWNMLFKRQSGKPLWMRSKIIDYNVSPNQTITIDGFMKPYSISYLARGNKILSQSVNFRKSNLQILEKETQLALYIDSLQFNKSNKVLIDSVNKEIDNIREEYNNKKLEYILQHPNEDLSVSFLRMQSKDTLIKYFPVLGEGVLVTPRGKALSERVKAYKQTEEGEFAPNIVDGSIFKLSDLKGKYVVLDFWGTWCGPCVSGLPKMRTYYKKYHSKIEFVGIACNDKKSVWEDFIKNEDLQWTQLLNNPKLNDFVKLFSIDAFPTKIIIDKKGQIVKRFEGETNDFYEKLDLLMKE